MILLNDVEKAFCSTISIEISIHDKKYPSFCDEIKKVLQKTLFTFVHGNIYINFRKCFWHKHPKKSIEVEVKKKK